MNYVEARRLDTMDLRWPKTEYLVQATHEETFQLWKQVNETVKWEQLDGWTHQIGEVDIRKPGERKFKRMPVCVCVQWNLLDGHLICFYESTSMVVDYAMVDTWIREKCEKHTNATNFHHVMHDLKMKWPAEKRSTP